MYLSKIGEPQGLAKNIRLCVCPAERDRTFEGVPIIDGGGGRRYKKNPTCASFCGIFLRKREDMCYSIIFITFAGTPPTMAPAYETQLHAPRLRTGNNGGEVQK